MLLPRNYIQFIAIPQPGTAWKGDAFELHWRGYQHWNFIEGIPPVPLHLLQIINSFLT